VPDPDTLASETLYTPLGENRQRVLVLVEEPDAYHLPEGNQQFLEKILQALSLSLADVCLVNVARVVSPDGVEGELDFIRCISFGMPPEPWQFSNFFRKYEVIGDESERAYLCVDSLAEISQDVEKKKLLWQRLKSLFHYE
jgi:DNA polymerase III psi subunit